MLQEGYGVNTFKLINAEGREHLCKFHVMPKEGEVNLSDHAIPSHALQPQRQHL